MWAMMSSKIARESEAPKTVILGTTFGVGRAKMTGIGSNKI